MSHRVISGKAKGRRLQLVPGDVTRPVMDRVKEALFNILGTGVVDASFLDLFAGTGAVGIEALSRGAAYVRFVDSHRLAIKTVYANLEHTRLGENADVQHTDALVYLSQPATHAFEYIYVAPPQYKGLWKQALEYLDANPDHMAPDATVIVQIDPVEKEDEELTLHHLELYSEREYGSTLLMFFEALETAPPADDEEDEPA